MTTIDNCIESDVNIISKKYADNDKNLFRLIEHCKSFYEIDLLEKNLSIEFKNFCNRANDYLDYFARTLTNDQESAIYELTRFINCIKHYEEERVFSESNNNDKIQKDMLVNLQEEIQNETRSDSEESSCCKKILVYM